MKNFKRHIITAALPYANGGIHIGHLAGVYVPADIYARYLRLRGRDALFVCGSDEHGVPITLKAKREGITPQQVVDKYHTIIKKSFEEFGISFDIFSRTSNKVHHETASEFFSALNEKSEFIKKITQQYYDEENKQFLADRYISGTCPNCGNENAYGDQCEKCGSALSPTDLINPRSTISGSTLVLKDTEHWFLPLDKYQPFLEKWILEDHKDWKPNVIGACKSWFDMGLKPRAVSRDLDWGVPVPVPNSEGKVLYVWFDAPIGYISATKELTPDWEKYWKSSDSQLVHFIGKDNIVFHCIIFPAMLNAEGSYILPENVPANQFLNLENDKISTSRNWAVWLHEYLQDFENKQDVLRYVLTANAPDTKDSDFTWKDFQARNNNELLAVFGNFVNRSLVLTKKYFNNQVPEPQDLTEDEIAVLAEITKLRLAVEGKIELYRFRDALKSLMALARLGNKFLAETEPWKLWKTEPEKVKNILYIALQLTAALSTLAEPFLPFSAAKLRGFLNLSEAIAWDKVGTELLPIGHQLAKAGLLFEKISDEQVTEQVNKLQATKNANAAKIVPPAKENITFDDFQKMDIRTAVVLEAERVKKTKKLLKLLVDTGIDKRTVVSGIAEYYKPEELIGKRVVVLVNLEPRKIRGIVSQGMVLMAENHLGELSFVASEKEFAAGREIS